MQYGELLSRVDYLAAEVPFRNDLVFQIIAVLIPVYFQIVLEKRLGIAQLCLLLVVLVFMGLTRGEAPQSSDLRSSVREWGRKNLSLSNSWVGRLTSRSRNNSSARKPTLVHLMDGIGWSQGCIGSATIDDCFNPIDF